MRDQDSEIVHHDGGTTLSGPDATLLAHAATVKSGIDLWVRSKMKLTRHAGIKDLLALATKLTGHSYKNNDAGHREASKDVSDWIETMRAALPITDERTKKEAA